MYICTLYEAYFSVTEALEILSVDAPFYHSAVPINSGIDERDASRPPTFPLTVTTAILIGLLEICTNDYDTFFSKRFIWCSALAA